MDHSRRLDWIKPRALRSARKLFASLALLSATGVIAVVERSAIEAKKLARLIFRWQAASMRACPRRLGLEGAMGDNSTGHGENRLGDRNCVWLVSHEIGGECADIGHPARFKRAAPLLFKH